jgi:hypothetical protein
MFDLGCLHKKRQIERTGRLMLFGLTNLRLHQILS